MQNDAENVRVRGSGTQRVYVTLRREILSMALEPGSPLDEVRLSERFGMSRTPIREALLRLADAYDAGVVGVGGGYLGDTGTWCVLNSFPTSLASTMCNGATSTGALNGPLGDGFPGLVVGIPPFGAQEFTFYIAFIRPIVGPPPSINEPAVAVSIMVEPSVTAEGGDAFKGDDVVFGFLPASTGFPWMSGQ